MHCNLETHYSNAVTAPVFQEFRTWDIQFNQNNRTSVYKSQHVFTKNKKDKYFERKKGQRKEDTGKEASFFSCLKEGRAHQYILNKKCRGHSVFWIRTMYVYTMYDGCLHYIHKKFIVHSSAFVMLLTALI